MAAKAPVVAWGLVSHVFFCFGANRVTCFVGLLEFFFLVYLATFGTALPKLKSFLRSACRTQSGLSSSSSLPICAMFSQGTSRDKHLACSRFFSRGNAETMGGLDWVACNSRVRFRFRIGKHPARIQNRACQHASFVVSLVRTTSSFKR